MTNLTRRNFLKVSAAGTATAILVGCQTQGEKWETLEPYVRAPEEQLAGLSNWYATTCRMCPAGCGVVARVVNGRAIKLEGNPEHPVNRGKLCARGQAGLQLLYNPDRVTGAVHQAERGSRKFEPVAWNEAINTLYDRINGAGGQVAVWTGSTTSAHLFDLFGRFTQAIGAPTPLRFDLYSSLNGYRGAADSAAALFGGATQPAYDISSADVILSFGADFLGTWYSSAGYGVEFGQFRSQPNGKRGYLVQFEPRMSNTGAAADRWIPVVPGAEGLVAAAIARIIADEGYGGAERAARAASLAGQVDITSAAAACGLPVEELTRLARIFAEAEHPLALPGSTLAGQPRAEQAIGAVQALNFVAGNIGQTGGVLLPPALPEGAELMIPPVSSLADARDLVNRMNGGEVQVLLVHGANPAYELPANLGFGDALANVPFVVSFNPIVDETSVQADYILPDRVYLESWGYEVALPAFNGIPAVSAQQPVVAPLYDLHAAGDVLLAVARGIPAAASALPWEDEVSFIRETIAALPAGAQGGEDTEVRWARFLQHGGWWPAEAPEVAVPEAPSGTLAAAPAQYQGEASEYPYFLVPYMSTLLGDGRGASLPWLQGVPDPMTTITWQTWVEINPVTAHQLDVENGSIVRVRSPYGEIEAPVYVYPAIRPDTIAIPTGQGHTEYGRYARERGANPLRLLNGQAAEGGGEPGWAAVRVQVERTGDKKSLSVFETTMELTEAEIHVPEGLGEQVGKIPPKSE